MKSAFEAMGGTYRQCGDFFIPEIALPDTPEKPLGKYGRMRHRYLKEHRRVLYNAMILDGTLWSHLAEVDKTCKERMDMLVLGMKETQGITEELKARDSMAWVGAMNNIRSAAEEVVLRDIINK